MKIVTLDGIVTREVASMSESVSDVAGLGTVLGIWAHPDDEAYLSGGLMAMARDIGSRVVCVTATRGELGTPDPETWPPQRLAAERTVELASCLEVLGVSEQGAVAASLAIVLVTNFFLARTFIFRSAGDVRHEVARFVVTSVSVAGSW